jgi:hypothetical protein
MNFNRVLAYLWKLPLCALAFFVGITLGGMTAVLLGLPNPSLPEGTDQATLSLYFLLASLILALALSFVARGLSGGFFTRWLILASLIWVVYAANAYIEAAIYTTFAAASLFTVVTFLVASVLCSAALALCFPPEQTGSPFLARTRAFFAQRPAWDWAWRLLVMLAAFPAIYLFFGFLVAPFVADYYRQQLFGLSLPGWGQIITAQLLRSPLFLLTCLPILIAWQRSSRGLVVALGGALFVLVGLLAFIPAYWMPLSFRMVHSLEILADSFVYAWLLVFLLVPPAAASGWRVVAAH